MFDLLFNNPFVNGVFAVALVFVFSALLVLGVKLLLQALKDYFLGEEPLPREKKQNVFYLVEKPKKASRRLYEKE